jgi:hypothetical protein
VGTTGGAPMKRPILTDFQRGVIVHAALWAATIAIVGFLALWGIVALLVGTVTMIEHIGGWV